ncbi:MAG: ATP phosphoribosyltransferase [Desulfobacteraceae bacterium]|nr:ATP phosphoribosyltransferase [Desulfobacteraceae bacterium]
MLQVALPNKGGLSAEAVQLVKEAGYNCRRYGRELAVRDSVHEIEFIFLRPRDIAVYVSEGVLALGITGRDLAVDSQSSFEELLELRFGKSRFFYAVPTDSGLTPADLGGLRIATSYTHLVQKDLARRGISADVIRLDGAVEISIQLGVADAIADVVESGRTMFEAGLKTIGEPILESEALLISRQKELLADDKVKTFVERLNGIVVAREYVMVEYDLPEKMLEMACMITPGIESPTISPLSKKGWVAVKSMARKPDINTIMDKLTAVKAKGIIVTDIRTCRM